MTKAMLEERHDSQAKGALESHRPPFLRRSTSLLDTSPVSMSASMQSCASAARSGSLTAAQDLSGYMVEPKNEPSRLLRVMRIIVGIAFAVGSVVLAGCCLWREATGEPEPLPPSPPPPYASAPPSHYAPGPYAPGPYPRTQSYAPAPPSNPQYEDGRG